MSTHLTSASASKGPLPRHEHFKANPSEKTMRVALRGDPPVLQLSIKLVGAAVAVDVKAASPSNSEQLISVMTSKWWLLLGLAEHLLTLQTLLLHPSKLSGTSAQYRSRYNTTVDENQSSARQRTLGCARLRDCYKVITQIGTVARDCTAVSPGLMTGTNRVGRRVSAPAAQIAPKTARPTRR